jgi:hypothetical protein
VANGEWTVADLTIETPGPLVGVVPHNVNGRGKVRVAEGCLLVAVRPRGLAGLLPPTYDRRSYPLSTVTGWEVRGDRVEFTAGAIAVTDAPYVGQLTASNAAAFPVHICGFRCADADAAARLTLETIAGGLDTERVSRQGSV